jgi:RNA polymerase sigma-70 factor (ECF subfamily)
MVNEASDGDIVAASLAEPARFGILFDRYYAAIHAYLRRRVGADEAEDLAAETFVRAFRTRGRFEADSRSAKPWLFGIATNLLLHHWRRERRRLRAYARTGIDPVVSPADEIDNRLDAAAAGPGMARALASLSVGERDVLLLHAWAELSDAEIAEALGTALGTVHSRLSRARHRIREALPAIGKEEGATPAEETKTRRREWTSSSS